MPSQRPEHGLSAGRPATAVLLVTKTFRPDLERCELLCRSVDRFIGSVPHWIIVDAADFGNFKHLDTGVRRVVTTEQVVPARLARLSLGRFAPRRNIWLSPQARPMRGWLVQQIAKLAVADAASEDVLLFVDSDIVFMRRFDPQQIVAAGEVPLLRVAAAIGPDLPRHVAWHRTAERLLGLPHTTLPAPDFVGPLIFWRRENVLALQAHMETRTGKRWIAAIARASSVSEYTLYGRFVDDELGPASGHSFTTDSHCHNYWPAVPLNEAGVEEFVESAAPTDVAVMLNPKAGMRASWYGPLLEQRWS